MQEPGQCKTTQDKACGTKCEALPFAILAFAVAVSFMLQLQQTVAERTMLTQAREGQTQILEQAKDVQGRLEQLAAATLKLAESGNENAKTVISRMKQAGVTVSPPKEGATPASESLKVVPGK